MDEVDAHARRLRAVLRGELRDDAAQAVRESARFFAEHVLVNASVQASTIVNGGRSTLAD